MKLKSILPGICFRLSFAFLSALPATAQDLPFTNNYPAGPPFSRTESHNSNMIITPYYGTAIDIRSDQSYLMVSNVTENKFSVKLTAVRHDGSLIWSKVYKSSYAGQARRCFAITYDARNGGYLLTGYQNNLETNRDDLWLMSIDALGNVQRDYSFNADSIPCSYTATAGPIGFSTPCYSFNVANFYGLDMLQVTSDPDSTQNGDFVITGFLSDKPSVSDADKVKRSFVWRFALPQQSRLPVTRYLKVFHGVTTRDVDPSRYDLTTDVEEIPGYGLMLLGHRGGPFLSGSTDPDALLMGNTYYALMPYNGGGVSVYDGTVFQYARTFNPSLKNVRSLLGKDGYIYMLGYSYPKKALALTQLKPGTGDVGYQYVYYTSNTQPLPALSMYQSQNDDNTLVMMGYRLGNDKSFNGDYVHPYTLKVSLGGTLLSNFNLERIYSPDYIGYAPAGSTDFFRPFAINGMPIASIPNIGYLNRHPKYDDAAIAGVLQDTTHIGKPFRATISGFRFATDGACGSYSLTSFREAISPMANPFNLAINSIRFSTESLLPTVRDASGYYTCDGRAAARPEGSTAPAGNTLLAAGDVKLYPNPVSDQLHLEAAQDGKYSYTVSAITGQVLYSGSFEHRHMLSTGGLAQGTYWIRIIDEKGVQQVLKFTKQ